MNYNELIDYSDDPLASIQNPDISPLATVLGDKYSGGAISRDIVQRGRR
jgi:hypothetical protein